MKETDLKTSVMGRRDFLQACALLSLGGLVFGVSEVVARPTPVKSEFVVINGWVLPAQHFRQTQA
ncbi:hypothetical protein C4E44_09570 [Pseudomonas sp. MWU12-2312b]|uniref:twin-arginine translocation signal domain-containing protein n=1 Tax=Pseudomonas moorei TaxID=395599 RepID=UPI000D40DB33|nr:hypothetical protein C4E44_09570 [Pseudomonas sp. MWU12-2312b]